MRGIGRRHAVWWVAAVTVSFLAANALAQQGRPTGQDYYTANQSPNIQGLLQSVERAHLKNVSPWIMKRGYDYALKELDYTLVTFPNHPEGLQLLWLYAKATRKPSVAFPYFDTAVRMYPQYAETHFLYGIFLVEFDLVKEGILRLEKALEIEPKMAIALAWIAKAHAKAGEDGKARESARKAIEMGYEGNLLGNILKETR